MGTSPPPGENQPHGKSLCGARTRQGHACKRVAGYGTDHLGRGRCKWHGGASHGAPLGNENGLKHGLTREDLLTIRRPQYADMLSAIKVACEGLGDLELAIGLWRDQIRYCVQAMNVLEAEYEKILAHPPTTIKDLEALRFVYEDQRWRWFGRLNRLLELYPQQLEKVRALGLDVQAERPADLVLSLVGPDGSKNAIVLGAGQSIDDMRAGLAAAGVNLLERPPTDPELLEPEKK